MWGGWNPKKPNSWKAVLTTAFLRAGRTQVALPRPKQTALPGDVYTHRRAHPRDDKKKKKKIQSIQAHKVMSETALCPSHCRHRAFLRARGAPHPRLLPCCRRALCSAAGPSPSPAFIFLF